MPSGVKQDKPVVSRINDTNLPVSSNTNPARQIKLNFGVYIIFLIDAYQSTACHDVKDSVYQITVLDAVVIRVSDIEEFGALEIDSNIRRIIKFAPFAIRAHHIPI